MDKSTETLVRVQNWLQSLLQCIYRRQGEVLEVPADSAYYYLDLITETLKAKTVDTSLAHIENSLGKLIDIVDKKGGNVLVK